MERADGGRANERASERERRELLSLIHKLDFFGAVRCGALDQLHEMVMMANYGRY